MADRAKIKEIFTSIQGEGPYIGVKQLFVRFCGCNLMCEYCDTNYDSKDSRIYTVDELLND
jgi:organic radical activating enzyme